MRLVHRVDTYVHLSLLKPAFVMVIKSYHTREMRRRELEADFERRVDAHRDPSGRFYASMVPVE
jgi:hypothetical protein